MSVTCNRTSKRKLYSTERVSYLFKKSITQVFNLQARVASPFDLVRGVKGFTLRRLWATAAQAGSALEDRWPLASLEQMGTQLQW